MSKIDKLALAYNNHITIPWREDASPEERVIFCVYSEADELNFRSKMTEFELVTKKAGHRWLTFDFTDSFADWLSKQKYHVNYFEKPNLLPSTLEGFSRWLNQQFEAFLVAQDADANTVVALTGVASLFGFLKVRDVISAYAPLVIGRLVVFFPGNYENNNYRLLDAYDGWNYLAVPITASADF